MSALYFFTICGKHRRLHQANPGALKQNAEFCFREFTIMPALSKHLGLFDYLKIITSILIQVLGVVTIAEALFAVQRI